MDFITIGPKDNPKKYYITKPIGSGAFGKVFLGSTEQNKLVAIKILSDKSDEKAFIREVQCLIGVEELCKKTPYILCYLDHFITNDLDRVIVTNFIEGYVTLRQYIFDKRDQKVMIDKEQVINEIYKAVKSIHDIGVAHGDLNSGNILIDPKTLSVKLIDFGNCSVNDYYWKNRDFDDIEELKQRIDKVNSLIKNK